MNESQGSLSLRRIARVAVAMIGLYCIGYALQAAGWHTVQRHGETSAPYPVFFSEGLVRALVIVATIASLWAAGVLRLRPVWE
jgi:hypothetical protein